MTEQNPVELKAFCEFKPMRDEFEFTLYFFDPMGNKQRYDFNLPATIVDDLAGEGYGKWDHRIILDCEYKEGKDMNNRHRPAIYEERRPPVSFFDYLDRFVISLHGDYANPKDPTRVHRFLADKDDREEFYMNSYIRDKKWRAERYEKWLATEAKAKELGLSDQDAGIRRVDKSEYPE